MYLGLRNINRKYPQLSRLDDYRYISIDKTWRNLSACAEISNVIPGIIHIFIVYTKKNNTDWTRLKGFPLRAFTDFYNYLRRFQFITLTIVDEGSWLLYFVIISGEEGTGYYGLLFATVKYGQL